MQRDIIGLKRCCRQSVSIADNATVPNGTIIFCGMCYQRIMLGNGVWRYAPQAQE